MARDRAAYAATRRTFWRLVAVLDATIHPKGRKRTWEELDALKRDLTIAQQRELLARLDAFNTRLLAIPDSLLPTSTREQYDGSACIDATVLPSFARGRAMTDTNASTDPDGGYYTRDGDHGEDTSGKKETIFGGELHTMVGTDVSDRERIFKPSTAISVAFGCPGVDPAGNARRVLAAAAEAGHKPGYLTGDGLYTDQQPDNYQTPARDLGWKVIMAFPDKHLGVKATFAHAILIEGDFYCPSTPEPLKNATIDHRKGLIDKAEYDQRIAARAAYLLRAHDKRGASTRFACPASGACPQVMCALKPKSMQPHPTTVIDGGQKIDSRPVVIPAEEITKGNLPRVCRQETITIPDSVNAQEGYHGYVKDEAKEALADPGKRRVAGLTAQSLFAAFAYFAGNLRKVTTFLRDARPDENGRLYVPRPKMIEQRASKPDPEHGAMPLAA